MLSVCTVFGSGRKIGTVGAPELMIPMGARNVALGGANVANVFGVESIYWNPAGLARVANMEATVNYMTYFADMTVTYMAAGASLGNVGRIGLSIQSLEIGDIPVTTIESPEGTGEVIAPDYITVTGTFSRAITDRFNFGANVKVVTEAIGNMNASAFAFDLGLQYVSSATGVGFGVVMRNIGGRVKFDGTSIEFDSDVPWSDPSATTRKTKLDMASHEIPASLVMGVSYALNLGESQSINIASSFNNENFALNSVNMGAEYNLNNTLFLRGGYASLLYPEDYEESVKESVYTGLSMGLGVKLAFGGGELNLDYAYRAMEVFSANQYFGITASF
ncbi:PorV/PorQ family protein [Candidatus Neomarinimicrobiota bacterium]